MAKVGDVIKVHGDISFCFQDGDIGVLTKFDGLDWWADINGGEWCVGIEDHPYGFEVIAES